MAMTRRRRERGSATIEMVVVAPALLLVIGLLIVGGRITLANGAVEHAAAEAARSATLARTQGEAYADALDAAYRTLDRQNIQCVGNPSVSPELGAFSTLPGQAASVTVTVVCVADLSDIAIPGLPGTRRLEAQVSSPLDTYRERS